MASVNDAFVQHLRNKHRQEQRLKSEHPPRSRDTGADVATQATANNHGDYSREVCGSPTPYDREGSTSGESMSPNGQFTPPESPAQRVSPGADVDFHRLSLEHNENVHRTSYAPRGRGQKAGAPSKRAASSDLPRDPGKQWHDEVKAEQTPRAGAGAASRNGLYKNKGRGRQDPRGRDAYEDTGAKVFSRTPSHAALLRGSMELSNTPASSPKDVQAVTNRCDHHYPPLWKDSGYGSRQTTLTQPKDSITTPQPAPPQPTTLPAQSSSEQPSHRQRGVLTLPQKVRFPGMILQPESCPISEDQLTAEIKAIYAGLVVVEAKCINVDAAQACDPSSELDQGRWQALIGLHRTLLYEHHDFLMATQHPSATPALRALPTKYTMPARMWKHAIHGFLEVLRHRRPELQDYMVSFIYLAYQMMALLYETVPMFLDTWIECLGDLARYRMAIEEEREEHAQWASVAASWYIKASDRHPQIGRLYHHLAILERPSLRKFACYGKSLTCVVPFPNARESLHTLCGPIAEEAQPARPIALQTEAALCKLHAVIYLAKPDSVIRAAFDNALSLLQRPEAFKWRDCGVPLAVANISALLGHGMADNPLRIAFDRTIRRAMQRSRPSQMGGFDAAGGRFDLQALSGSEHEEARRLLSIAKRLTLSSLHTCLRCLPGTAFFRDSLAFVSVMLCFLHFFALTKKEIEDDSESQLALCLVFGLDEVSWTDVAGYLNHITHMYPVTPHIVRSAQQGTWLEKAGEAKPLPDDYSIRGLVWSHFAFPPGWFDSDEDQDWVRTVETASTHKVRGDRGLYYGLRLAYETPYLTYDSASRTFAANAVNVPASTESTLSLQSASLSGVDTMSQRAVAASASPSSPTTSGQASSGSDSDFVHVRHPQRPVQAQPQRATAPAPAPRPAPAKTWAAVAKAGSRAKPTPRPVKQRPEGDVVRVVDPDRIEWNAEA